VVDAPGTGDFYISIAGLGFAPFTSNIFHLDSESLNMGEVKLTPSSVELNTLEVVYTKPLIEVKPDMTVFNVENTMNASGNTALELLRKAPGVTVDNNDNIMLKGRSDVLIYIDGKPSPLDAASLAAMLKNMQSSGIEAIEIISNPSAKYDAAGTGGIINIRLKKNKNFGTNGTANITLAQGIVPKYNGGLTLNHRNEYLNAFGNYNYSAGPRRNWMDLYRIQNGKIFDQITRSENDNISHNYKAGADFFLSSRHTIGFFISGNETDEKWNNESITVIGPEENWYADQKLVANVKNDGSRGNHNLNLNYVFSDTSGTSLKIDADAGRYRIRTNSYQPNVYYTAQGEEVILDENIYLTESPTDIDLFSLKADYERNLFKGKFGAGFKVSQVMTQNTFRFFNVQYDLTILDPEQSNRFSYEELIGAAYLNYSRQWTKLGMQLGLRAERTSNRGELDAYVQEDQVNDTTYTNVFPNVSFSYALNPTNSLGISYSRRISRPSYQDLNPFEFKLDELSYMKGNPFLRPEFTDNIELSHTYKYMYTTTLTMAHTSDFSTMNIYAEGDASYISQTNLGYQRYAAVSIGAPVNPVKWLSIYANLTGYYQRTVADLDDGTNIDIDFVSYNYFAQMGFTLPKDYTFEVSGWGSGPGLWGGTFKNRPMRSIDVGLKKNFMENRATVKVVFTDVFHTARWRGVSNIDGQFMDTRGGWESQQLRLDLSIRFGNQNVKVKEKKGGADDLKSRVK
jgi:outer membrane receptor protein involved in Fe transport